MAFLEINKKYILYFEIGEKQLTYVCTILEVSDKFVKIRDKYGNVSTFALDSLKQIKEISE